MSDHQVLRNAARYLGLKGAPEGEQLSLLARALGIAREQSVPKHVLVRAGVMVNDGEFTFDGVPPLQSRDLCRLFEGAQEGFGLLLTLGAELDQRVKRLMITDPALGAAVGACAAADVDEEIDKLLLSVEADVAREGLTLSPRFSPGYGDVPLAYQRPFLARLEARRIGVTLTAANLMLPEKTVSALIALRPRKGEMHDV